MKKTKRCKILAMRDIAKECGEAKFYTQNYLRLEKIIVSSTLFEYFPIDTTIY